MKKKILITSSTLPRWDKDTEPRFVLDYAKSIQQYYDVTILAPAAIGAKDTEVIEGVDIIRYHYFPIHKWETLCYPGAIMPRIHEKKIRGLLVPFMILSLWFKILKIYKNYDLIHSHWMIPQGAVQSVFHKKPYILTGHGGDITSLNSWFMKKVKKASLKHARHVTVVSDSMKDYVNSIYPNDKTTVLPMGCDTSVFKPDNHIENYFGQGDKKVVLFVGRLAEVKGVEYLINAVEKLDDVMLCIVGTGNLESELKALAKPMGDKVVFLGAKTHGELSTIIPSSDMLVMPSITASDGGKEGFGLVIIEAMASGIPVIASNSGGIPNTVKHEFNGLLTEEKDVQGIADAISRVISDDALRDTIVTNGLATSKQHDYSEVARGYKKIIDGVLGE